MLPQEVLAGAQRDGYGHVSFATLDLSKLVAERVAARYKERTGRHKKVSGVQLGYESRCSAPHAFDVLLGSQLGYGAYRALAHEGLDGHMVSVSGQLSLCYVPFAELIDQQTLTTQTRFIEPGSDYHQLAQALGTRLP
jgi:6-phosphofructokinase 1